MFSTFFFILSLKVDVASSPGMMPETAKSAPGSRKSSVSSAIKRRNSRAAERRASSTVRDDRSDDSGSINTIDQTSKLWMVKSAQGDYHTMTKMLRDDPRLAKHKDFTSGFTALHWAAKHGNYKLQNVREEMARYILYLLLFSSR